MRQWVEGGVAGIVVGALVLVRFDQVPAAGWLLTGAGLVVLVGALAVVAARRAPIVELAPLAWRPVPPLLATALYVPAAWFAGAPRVALPLDASGRVVPVAATDLPWADAPRGDVDFAPLEVAFFAAGETLHERAAGELDFADLG
jgi:hypothetical protein